MRIVFMGSPEFAIPSLRSLTESGREVVAVVTQPDKPAGRGRVPTPPPVKVFAEARGLRVLQPVSVSAPPAVEQLRSLEPDVLLIAAYGQILRQRVLDLPTRGSLNVHSSLLPRWRGAAPVAAAILAGDEVTGVTIMEVVRALDAGPMVAKVEVPISAHDTAGTLEARLSDEGANLLVSSIDAWYERRIEPQPQDDDESTYAPMLRRQDARIDWSKPAVEIWRAVRAYNPWPVAFTSTGSEELRILEAWPLSGGGIEPPGTVLTPEDLPPDAGAEGRAPLVQTGDGRLALVMVQRAGKKGLAGQEFLRGQRDFVGSRLG